MFPNYENLSPFNLFVLDGYVVSHIDVRKKFHLKYVKSEFRLSGSAIRPSASIHAVPTVPVLPTYQLITCFFWLNKLSNIFLKFFQVKCWLHPSMWQLGGIVAV